MKKNLKTVSYILVLGALLSSVQPAVAQTNWFNRGRVREAAQQFQERAVEAIASLEARIKNLLGQLDEYRQCVMSKEGCSPEQKATLRKAGWGVAGAITALLLLSLLGWYEQKRKEGVREVPEKVAKAHEMYFGHPVGEMSEGYK